MLQINIILLIQEIIKYLPYHLLEHICLKLGELKEGGLNDSGGKVVIQ